MWTYGQASGNLKDPTGVIVGCGYSGFEDGKNNPALEAAIGVGPIPRGEYAIADPHDDPEVGPFAMRLTPTSDTDTLGRYAFLIHGDSIEHPGQASHGCIILAPVLRHLIAASGDKLLQVVP
jgi:hypothetical protein